MTTTAGVDARLITVGELYADPGTTYTIPIYQRNFAWGAEQIEQLIDDVRDAQRDGGNYFLGNVIVVERNSSSGVDYEVIDGQQRLTTLFMLLTYLDSAPAPHPSIHAQLQYEFRPKATEALRRITMPASTPEGAAPGATLTEDSGIHAGYNVIRQHMNQSVKTTDHSNLNLYLRENVQVVRASLPRGIDLNRYFEIMNTRGEQLQQVDIVKARLMRRLSSHEERATFAWIWEACADMESYIQMSLTRGDTAARTRAFGSDWTHLELTSFSDLVALRRGLKQQVTSPTLGDSGSLSLSDAIAEYAKANEEAQGDDDDNVRFSSIIDFPVFLLHVLRLLRGPAGAGDDEGQLDDKRLIERFAAAFPDTSQGREQRSSSDIARFAYLLLRSRALFDTYVIKREFTATNGEDGDWSLRRLVRRPYSGNRVSAGYPPTFTPVTDESDVGADATTTRLLMVQSMLRVTYTSARTMHWITELLRLLDSHDDPRAMEPGGLISLLEDYARDRVQSAFFAPNERPQGFDIPRIVFTYLDYLLLTREPPRLTGLDLSGFRFGFRNSIEHFFPQHPDHEQIDNAEAVIPAGKRHWFGNLALVSVGVNSKFSNNLPRVKAVSYRESIVKQSPKLVLMGDTASEADGWTTQRLQEHHNEMIEILASDVVTRGE